MPGEKEVVLLLLGPTRSGKTSFAQCVGEPTDGIVDRRSTTACKEYRASFFGANFIIIDTPGLDDSPAGNLAVLGKIAQQLEGGPTVRGAIYFQRITNSRLTGSARTNIDIFQQICGRDFFRQAVFVTTMWNTLDRGARPKFEKLEKELQGKFHNMTDEGTVFFQFDSNRVNSAKEVLRHFKDLSASSSPARLLMAREVETSGWSPSSVRRTTAGKLIVKNMNRGLCVIL